MSNKAFASYEPHGSKENNLKFSNKVVRGEVKRYNTALGTFLFSLLLAFACGTTFFIIVREEVA